MSKEKAPALPFYVSDYLSDLETQSMTPLEEYCYLRLIFFCWREVSIPTDIDVLKSLCKGVEPTEKVLRKFYVKNGKYLHKKLQNLRNKRRAFLAACKKGGKNSAHKRKHKKEKSTEQLPLRSLDNYLQVNPNISFSFSSSYSSTKKRTTIVADRLAKLLRDSILRRDPKAQCARLKNLDKWVDDIEKLIRIDKRSESEIARVIEYAQSEGCFWNGNILSGKKLREKFDAIYPQMLQAQSKGYLPDTVGEYRAEDYREDVECDDDEYIESQLIEPKHWPARIWQYYVRKNGVDSVLAFMKKHDLSHLSKEDLEKLKEN
jgi:uncharacterized protein YdaU (DUF1376 family)